MVGVLAEAKEGLRRAKANEQESIELLGAQRAENHSLRLDLESVQTKIAQQKMAQQQRSLGNEVQMHKDALLETRKAFAALNDKYSSCVSQLKDLQNKHAIERADEQRRLEQMQRRASAAEQYSGAVEKEKEKLLDASRQKIDDLSRKLRGCSRERDEVAEQLKRERQLLQEARMRNKAMEDDLNGLQGRYDERLKRAISELREGSERRDTEIKMLRAMLKGARADNQLKDTQISRLRTQIEPLATPRRLC
mmetsp:Transcript_47444/g.118529  ORF Transcript_47444/g.118529 Transcript_47444/m.118529 type:complete len:251 (+) Transcript_47444:2-754(+)